MWKPFRCRLFGEHDYQLRREPLALYLECRRCGHRSRGWDLDAQRTRPVGNGFRLFIAESADVVRGSGAIAGSTSFARMASADTLRLTLGEDRDSH